MRRILTIFLILFLSLANCLNIVFVMATATGDEHGNTYINEDGSIEPSDSPIYKNGNVYTLTADLHGSNLLILRSHITFDGNGYTLYQSISLRHVTHVTVKNLLITNPTPGVSGISIDHASENIIQNNTIWECGGYHQMGLMSAAINILDGDSNIIVGNKITRNEIGLILPYQKTLIYNNSFVSNNLDVSSYVSSDAVFDNGEVGNYWSRYDGKDENGDGIGDTPYVIDQNNQDNYPVINLILSDSPPKNGPSNPDPFSNLPSAIIDFITSGIGLLLLAITTVVVGLIVILVLVLNRKRKSLEVVK